ncbi:MAG: hypothetical protein WD426_01990 [Anditalea sp.]
MKRFLKLTNYLFYGFIVGFLAIASCTEEENPLVDEPSNGTELNANDIQSKIILQNASSKDGDIPPSSNLADLKIDKDTIFLVEGFKNRIRILHPDHGFATGSSHFYIQVEGADKYYDVKAVEEESNDSIAVLYMDFDPGDIELPFSFNIKFAPHDNTGTAPIDETGKPVVIEKKGDLSCSPSSPEPHWDWMYTIIDGEIESAPGFGRTTETHVTGCCFTDVQESVDCISNGFEEDEWRQIDGISAYNIDYELLNLSNGDISGTLQEFIQNLNPSPGKTDFCSGSLGYITNTNNHAFWGNYTYDPSNSQIQFTNLESRAQEVDLGELGTYTVYDKMFIREDFLYELISCHFLMETGSVEGSSIIRIFEREKRPSNNWYD